MKIRGVIHMHSTHSYDGKLSLSELKELLVQEGISFCCMTEHTDYMTPEGAEAYTSECTKLSDESFLFIPGFEVPYKDAHVLHIGTETFHGQTADTHALGKWRASTPLVILAHPVRNRFKVDEHLAGVLDGVEIWNQQYEGKHAPRFRSMALYRTLKNQQTNLIATGGLDLHRKEHFGRPQLSLEVATLTEEAIIRALRNGNFMIEGNHIQLNAWGEFLQGNIVLARLKSFISIVIITVGKVINRVLAKFGLHLPRFIRARV